MADDIFETDEQETLEMDEVLEKVISYCAEEAKEKLAQVGSFEPFTVVVEGENMHIESHPGDDVDVIRARAREAVATASGAITASASTALSTPTKARWTPS